MMTHSSASATTRLAVRSQVEDSFLEYTVTVRCTNWSSQIEDWIADLESLGVGNYPFTMAFNGFSIGGWDASQRGLLLYVPRGPDEYVISGSTFVPSLAPTVGSLYMSIGRLQADMQTPGVTASPAMTFEVSLDTKEWHPTDAP